MDRGNNLSPRLVALGKDSVLKIFLDSWDNSMTFKEIKEYLKLNLDNNKNIIINKDFLEIPREDLCNKIDSSYSVMVNLIVDTLKFVGRPNDGTDIEWHHSHSH
jgi:hypothetical protein